MRLTIKVTLLVLLPALLVSALGGMAARGYSQAAAAQAAARTLELVAEQELLLIEARIDRLDRGLTGVLSADALSHHVSFAVNELDLRAERERRKLEYALAQFTTSDPRLRVRLYDHRGLLIVDVSRGASRRGPAVPVPAEGASLRDSQQRIDLVDGRWLRLLRRIPIDGDAGWAVTIDAQIELKAASEQTHSVSTRHLHRVRCLVADRAGNRLVELGEPIAGPLIRGRPAQSTRLPLTIHLEQERSAALALAETHALHQTSLQLVLGGALALLLWLGMRYAVLGPVQRIGARIEAIKRGETPPPPPRGNDELSGLDRILHAALSELWTLTGELEQRVLERTAALEASEQRYQLAVQGANDAIWDWDLTSDRMYLSPRWRELLGDQPVAPGLEGLLEHVHPDDRDGLERALEEHSASPGEPLQREFRVVTPGGERWILARGQATRDSQGAIRMAGSLSDITAHKQAQEELRRQAVTDPLTGLASRAQLIRLLEQAIDGARRYGHALTLAMCDIDRFKQVNDTHGHRLGDQVLARFGELVRATLRGADIGGRYGGDEFCLVFPHTSAAAALTSTERIRTALAAERFGPEGELQVSCTFGVATMPAAGCSAADLMELADQGLYEAKRLGRNRSALAPTVREPGPVGEA